MQNQGTYIEQFLKLDKVTHFDVSNDEYKKDVEFKVAVVTDWWLDDTIDNLKHESSRIRFECDDKLMFMSDAKALLVAVGIIKNIAKNSNEDVIGTVKKLLSDLEVEA